MADLKYYDVILRPVVTEKSMNMMSAKKYAFYVHPEANKAQIKEAVQRMFEGTKVKAVKTMNVPGKKSAGAWSSAEPRRRKRLMCSSQRTARKSRSSQDFDYPKRIYAEQA